MRQQSRTSTELAGRFDREAAPYRGQLYARALRMTHNREDAEDLVQETLVRACGAFHRFSGDHFKAWLHRIMTNTFINSYRKHQREPPSFSSAASISCPPASSPARSRRTPDRPKRRSWSGSRPPRSSPRWTTCPPSSAAPCCSPTCRA